MKTRALIYPLPFVLVLCVAPMIALAMAPSESELAEAARWTAAKFGGVAESPAETPPGLVVLANHDPVQRNARAARPMRIADAEFTRGLYCHAFSQIVVRLPGPGEVFTAVVGMDSNEQTHGGRGSVRFAVLVDGAEAFKSGVLREGMAGMPVSVNLDGAHEFLLQVDDAGDGISCDQADWADAKVRLRDGREVWLADLPLREGAGRPPFTSCANEGGICQIVRYAPASTSLARRVRVSE